MTTSVKTSGEGPDFICFGAQKAGTEWLYSQLRVHPDFWMPPIKEIHYFDRPRKARRRFAEAWLRAAQNGKMEALARSGSVPHVKIPEDRDIAFAEELLALTGGRLDLERYAGLFRFKAGQLSGDITPAYSKVNEAVIAEIAGDFPSAKFVFMAREPIARLWSQVRMYKFGKRRIEGDVDVETIEGLLQTEDYHERAFQSEIVSRWKRHMGDRLSVFLFDDLVADAAGLRKRIIAFLGGDPEKPSGTLPPDYNRKAGLNPPLDMSPDVRAFLIQRFAGEVRACAALFGGAAEGWPERHDLPRTCSARCR